MAHEINHTSRGASAAFAITPAWHGLGAVIAHVMTWEEIYKAALLDYEVAKVPLFADGKQIQSHVATKRMDTGEILGVVGNDYQIVQNRDVFSFADTLIGNLNGAHYESAGALRKGERVWVLARIPDADITIGGQDKHLSYLLGLTSHDGSLADQYKLVQTRVVCANTLAVALREKGAFARFKHTTRIEERKALTAQVSGSIVANAKELEARLNRLSHIQLRKETFAGILDRLFPATAAGSGRRDKIVLKIMDLFETNDANAFPDQRGTAYNLLNAVTNYADHERGIRTSEQKGGASEAYQRAENAMFGGGLKLKESALAVIEDLTADESETSTSVFSMPTSDDAFMKALGIKGGLSVD